VSAPPSVSESGPFTWPVSADEAHLLASFVTMAGVDAHLSPPVTYQPAGGGRWTFVERATGQIVDPGEAVEVIDRFLTRRSALPEWADFRGWVWSQVHQIV